MRPATATGWSCGCGACPQVPARVRPMPLAMPLRVGTIVAVGASLGLARPNRPDTHTRREPGCGNGGTIVSSKILFILNDPPYGSERVFNGLRLATALAKRDGVEVRGFLIGDAVVAAMANQKLPDGGYHLDRMLGSAARQGADTGCCGSCIDARDHGGDAHQGHPPFHAGRAGRLDAVGRAGHHVLAG